MIRRFGTRVVLLVVLLGSFGYNVIANPTAAIATSIVDGLVRAHG